MKKLLDEECPSRYYWILLQNDLDVNLPQLKFWSLFTSEDNLAPYLQPNDPVRTFGMYLLDKAEKKEDVVDIYDQVVNLGQYNPNYMRIEQDFMKSFAEDKSHSKEDQIINSMITQKMSPNKAAFAWWEYKLINAYRYLKAQAKDNIFHDMSLLLWDNYLGKLMMNITRAKSSKVLEEDKMAEARTQAAQHASLRLDRLKVWRETGSWKYNDIVALCKLGLPKELRPAIWAELFGLSGVNNPDFETSKTKKYEMYVRNSMKENSIIYWQIEQDVKEILIAKKQKYSKSNSQHKERASILKIAKAYYAWCVEENGKNLHKSNFVYFKGILYVIQKVWQLFDEVEAFWCIVGFAKALPYFFNSQNVMAGNLSWNHKLLLLAITTIMEIKYPDLYAAIVRHGLPIEYYISDKLFTLLSKVFPTDTLLRFYDIIALEAGSKEPIRAMWVILTGCLMTMTLNEVYIKAARNVEEIELIINNTGINKLNVQLLVEDIYKLSDELFTIYNPTWEKFMAVILNKKDSVIGMEQTWTKKAIQLEERYKSVKELNTKIEGIIEMIRKLAPNLSAKKEIDDANWMDSFVKRFCKYYGNEASKDTPSTIYVYLNRCYNLSADINKLEINYGYDFNRVEEIEAEGAINKLITIDAVDDKMTLKITVKGNIDRTCTINLNEYEVDMPITLDKSLNLIGKTILHNGQKPQPFISLVFMTATIEGKEADDTYNAVKRCLMNESVFIKPANAGKDKQSVNVVEETKKNLKSQFMSANLKSAYFPQAKRVSEDEFKDPAESDKKALTHLFNLVKNGSISYYPQDLPEADSDVLSIADSIYDAFSKQYDNKLPLKRIIITLIAASYLTIDKKLSYFYDLYTCLAGVGGRSEERDTFLLDDIIELIQLLCELHLVYIPPEAIPHLTEQVMTNGGVNRITNCYLITANVKADEILKKFNLKGIEDSTNVLDVTSNVQESFRKYWEIWGHKQMFASDPNSFCRSLRTALNGSKVRPRNKGPYRLLICYKHAGEDYYRELEYDQNENLFIKTDSDDKINELLLKNCYNLSFVGERIKMLRNEFITKMKNIPLLTELMRFHISINNTFVPKTQKELRVEVMGKGCKLAIVNFDMNEGEENKEDKMEATPRNFEFDKNTKIRTISLPYACKEDLLVEIKERVINAIKKMLDWESNEHIFRDIPAEFDPSYLNHSLQFFNYGKALDDYSNIEMIDDNELTLKMRENDPHEDSEAQKTYAFHVHGDYMTEWIRCTYVKYEEMKCYVITTLLPGIIQEVSKAYLLTENKS